MFTDLSCEVDVIIETTLSIVFRKLCDRDKATISTAISPEPKTIYAAVTPLYYVTHIRGNVARHLGPP